MTQAGDDLQAEGVELSGSTISSESSDNDSSSRDGSDASSSDNGAPTPTAARTAAREFGAHMPRPGDGEEIREGRTRAQTRALHLEAAAGLISMTGPCDGGSILHALLAAQDAGGEPTTVIMRVNAPWGAMIFAGVKRRPGRFSVWPGRFPKNNSGLLTPRGDTKKQEQKHTPLIRTQ